PICRAVPELEQRDGAPVQWAIPFVPSLVIPGPAAAAMMFAVGPWAAPVGLVGRVGCWRKVDGVGNAIGVGIDIEGMEQGWERAAVNAPAGHMRIVIRRHSFLER